VSNAIAFLIATSFLLSTGCGRSPARTAATTPDSLPRWEGLVSTPDSVHLFTRVVGSGADTIIVLHGGPGFTLDYLAADLEPLAARHTLLFYDQRGAGRSTLVGDSAGLSAQRFVEDLEAVRAHFGLSKPTLLGHSWGVGLAALYAQRYSSTLGQLILVDGVPLREMQGVDRFTMASLGSWDWRAAMATVPLRTLIIHGTVDPIPLATAQEWATTLPNARLLTLLNVGHFPYLEAPDQFFAAIDTFMAGAWPAGAKPARPSP
jgi:proline iminopeptidase